MEDQELGPGSHQFFFKRLQNERWASGSLQRVRSKSAWVQETGMQARGGDGVEKDEEEVGWAEKLIDED